MFIESWVIVLIILFILGACAANETLYEENEDYKQKIEDGLLIDTEEPEEP